MSDPKNFRFKLKAMINKHKTKVLYVEADSDFADVLLSFLTLPLGTIVRVLKKYYGDHQVPVLGSLTTLYNGLHNLDSGLFLSQDHKTLLLNPENSSKTACRMLKISVDDTNPTDYFKYRDDTDRIGGVFIKPVSLIITDDLQILPNCMGSAVKILHNSGITDMIGIEERKLTFGFNEIMDLLKGSLFSRAPLTELILEKKMIDYTAVKCETDGIQPVYPIKKQKIIFNIEKMNVRAILQRSTNKLLFAEANYEFVDFLFSLLEVPLLEVESLLGSDTCLKNIDNLYKSVGNMRDDKYLKSNYLLQPEPWVSTFPWRQNCVESPTMFMLTDNLTITPSSSSSAFSVLSSLNIPLYEVRELELVVGVEEAKSILKASLTSACALTDGLIKPALKKEPKQESG